MKKKIMNKFEIIRMKVYVVPFRLNVCSSPIVFLKVFFLFKLIK